MGLGACGIGCAGAWRYVLVEWAVGGSVKVCWGKPSTCAPSIGHIGLSEGADVVPRLTPTLSRLVAGAQAGGRDGLLAAGEGGDGVTGRVGWLLHGRTAL